MHVERRHQLSLLHKSEGSSVQVAFIAKIGCKVRETYDSQTCFSAVIKVLVS